MLQTIVTLSRPSWLQFITEKEQPRSSIKTQTAKLKSCTFDQLLY
ncbi:MAG: hypothetical protein OFPI_41080 [Osedax symbiont Rs2]|nr:MAG: hypothetical protein OFPI_41080 [Osedax symbiont Rs2]